MTSGAIEDGLRDRRAPSVLPRDLRAYNINLFINELQARIVGMLFDWYESGEMNPVGIARRLTEMGIPRPTLSKGLSGKRVRRGSWVQVTVHYVMDPKNWTLPVGVELRTRNEVQDAKETQKFQCGVQNESSA